MEHNVNSFFNNQSTTPQDSPEGQELLVYKRQLEKLRDLFLYDIDLREITKSNIDETESELRLIIRGLNNLKNAPHTFDIIMSCDGIQATISQAIHCLYVASDLLPSKSARDRKELYAKFFECTKHLSKAIENFYKI